MKTALLSLAILLSIALIQPTLASADSVIHGIDCSNATSSAVCTDQSKTTNPIYGQNGLLIKIANIVAFIAGIAAIIIILVGSIRFITSGGDPQKASTARSTVVSALIGLLIIGLATTIIDFVINKFLP